ncbi:MAG TPA: ORF6N domain-containing protein [Bacteroides sp.]|nr:ORF6N domain-containing protein [Bacteroides sp.]
MEPEFISHIIFNIRGNRIILDFHLAELYKVSTKALKQAVRRNIERFSEDLMFELTRDEVKSLSKNQRSQSVTFDWPTITYTPFA